MDHTFEHTDFKISKDFFVKLFLLLSSLLTVFNVFGQVEKEPVQVQHGDDLNIPGRSGILGKVVEYGTGKPVPAASVQLFAVTSPGEKDSIVSVGISKPNGDFSFENIPDYDSLYIVVTSVNYLTESRYIEWKHDRARSGRALDIGNIILSHQEQQLEGVVITAQRPKMQLGIDKKVFDATQDLSAKGGTAVDIMKNIPSLSVDVDGTVTFRDGNPTIYVDGRPTMLTLEQIPADNIDRVELISNPSAKYDASSGGGILNIILKKDKRNGFNGMVNLSGGFPGIFRSTGNLNLRQNKLNFFVSGGYSRSGGEAKGSSFRISRDPNALQNYFTQELTNRRGREFRFIRGGMDFYMDNRNTISFQQGYVKGNFTNDQTQDQRYLDGDKTPIRLGGRTSVSGSEFTRNNSQINYTHNFPQDGHQLDASLTVNYGGAKTSENIENKFFHPDHSPDGDPQLVQNDGNNNSTQWTAQIDYANPISENIKIETGVRSFVNDYTSLFNSYNVSNGDKIKLPLSNHYEYLEQVHAVYFTYTNQTGFIGYQLGLRGEYSNFDGTLVDSAKAFGYTYPSSLKNIWNSLFPSIFLSKKLSENDELQLNYSRRVRRPNFWQLNPFIDINDPQNIQQGNPALKPQFRNSLEFNYSKTFGENNNNLLFTLYYRNIQDNITRFSDTLSSAQYAALQNSGVEPDAILNTFINGKSANNLGMEIVLRQRLAPGLDITPSLSMFHRKVNADVKGMDLSNNGTVWRAKLQSTYKIPSAGSSSLFRNLSVQLDGSYRSPMVIPQGKTLEMYSVDISFRKEFLRERKGALVFSINDIFDSRKRGTIYDTPSFYQESYNRWRTRSFRLTFSYRFGNADFQLFNKKGGSNGNNSSGSDMDD